MKVIDAAAASPVSIFIGTICMLFHLIAYTNEFCLSLICKNAAVPSLDKTVLKVVIVLNRRATRFLGYAMEAASLTGLVKTVKQV